MSISMYPILGYPFVLWACGAAGIAVFWVMRVVARGQRTLHRRNR